MREITAITKHPEPAGPVRWKLLFFYDISADPILDNNGTKVVAQGAPSAEISALLSQEQRDAIASGDALWEETAISQEGETGAQFLSRLETIYAARKVVWVDRLRTRYESTGLTADVA